MGAVNFSLDVNLVLALRQALPLETLVETGTFRGDTVANMLPHFQEIHSVEWSADLHAQAQSRFGAQPHVHCAQDTSPPWLRCLQPRLAGRSVLYWLDAHWCDAADTAGQDAQCPLLDELDAIVCLNESSVVLIDDARLFLSTPPNLHRCEQWPRFQPLVERLCRLSNRHELNVVNDVIAFIPIAARDALRDYCHRHSVDWAAVTETSRQQALSIDSLTAQLTNLAERHQTLLQAKNRRIAELEAYCRPFRQPLLTFKLLCRRMARLFGAPAPVAEKSPRQAA